MVYSNTRDNHRDRLWAVWIISKCKFDGELDKMWICLSKCNLWYLVKVMRQGLVRPVEAKVLAIKEFSVPITKKKLMKFWGLVGYYCCFCCKFSIWWLPLWICWRPKQSLLVCFGSANCCEHKSFAMSCVCVVGFLIRSIKKKSPQSHELQKANINTGLLGFIW